MLENEKYIIKLLVDGKERYLLYYYTSDDDCVLCEDGKLLIFNELSNLEEYVKSNSIIIAGDISNYDMDNILSEIKEELDCNKVLNHWNILDTLLPCSLNIEFIGRNEEYDDVYEQLFSGAMPADINDGYIRSFDEDELIQIRMVLTEGIKILKENI